MGLSTNGEISYGVLFDEGYEFPWGDKDIDDWWLDVNGFKHSFEIFDEHGEYLNGVRPSDDVIDKWFEEKEDFKKTIPPLPVEMVNYCSGDYPMYILAIPGTVQTANRGYPTKVSPGDMMISDSSLNSFREFITRFELKPSDTENWYLTSYMG